RTGIPRRLPPPGSSSTNRDPETTPVTVLNPHRPRPRDYACHRACPERTGSPTRPPTDHQLRIQPTAAQSAAYSPQPTAHSRQLTADGSQPTAYCPLRPC